MLSYDSARCSRTQYHLAIHNSANILAHLYSQFFRPQSSYRDSVMMGIKNIQGAIDCEKRYLE
ncbi:hypothetical protein PRIPAC_84963 [Pristionchus pacificus]|uniref:Uncharacterized protein n=1 Tax=Pristionchus pacificus TaxID=54126 RepID=A0A2A6BTG1_PRIPA|nr:hypothetical protein PRIPAC_84963 [Pristionchus pacificus]|eukprot:PDM69175.1 hypothetical protein PRIPAC_47477 [Pristionchus pacificus]